MNLIQKLLAVTFGSAFVIWVTTSILGFFGVDIEVYLTYLIWIIVLMVFAIVLPKKNSMTVFFDQLKTHG